MATEKQIAANQSNAQFSTGAVTPEGKSICSHNAVKTGLTGQTVLLKTDDLAAYQGHLLRFSDKFTPATDDERALVQDLADTEWRLLRIMPLESGILALGRRELAPLFADEPDPDNRSVLLEAKVFQTYKKDLNNLALQQTRLGRHRDKVTKELTDLQTTRKEKSHHQAVRAATAYLTAREDNWPCFHYQDFGFEFSIEQMFTQVAEQKLRQRHLPFPEVVRPNLIEEIRDLYQGLMMKQDLVGGDRNCHICRKKTKKAA